jgi:hypothetical protein
MQEVVVTGMRNPQTKLQSSVAITTANAAQISGRASRNTADLLQVIPGFYVESSGGEGGNNLFARGMPADGSFRYVTIYEDGLPVLKRLELAFANIDELMRVDETVEVMSGARQHRFHFASNAPAASLTLSAKPARRRPGDQTKLGDHGLFRADMNFGGPLAKNWRFNVGGFFRYDRRSRSRLCGQPRRPNQSNLTRLLRNGYVRLHAKFSWMIAIFLSPHPAAKSRRAAGHCRFRSQLWHAHHGGCQLHQNSHAGWKLS